MVTAAAYGFGLAFVLAAVHLTAGQLVERTRLPRRALLSLAGGTTVAYVIVLILPEVNQAVLTVVEGGGAMSGFFARVEEVYVVVLAGFAAFYGIHVFVTTARRESAESADLTFWTHVAVFSCYDALIGYLLFHQELPGVRPVFLYAVTMGLHFLVTDAGLRRHHGRAYLRVGRWVLAGSVLVGAFVGYGTNVDETVLALLFAFLAGSIVFNVLVEELPSVDWRRFASFLVGAAAYTWLLLLQ